MTSLSQQLQVIQNDRLGLSRVTPSYLYSPREASKLRLEDVFSLASNAFRSLLAKEPRLSKIQESLISDASQRCDRTVLTAQENEKLNGAIEHACRLLGPFVLDRDCAHFLEWLVRRFRVQEYNVKAILALFLPFHETPQFAQMLQLLYIEKAPESQCLAPVKKALQTLPRHTLTQYMTESPAFATFVATLLPVAIKKKTFHRALIAFWTASLLSYISRKDFVTQEELGIILPGVYDAIRQKGVAELQLSGYIVLVQLTSKTAFAPEALQSLIGTVASRLSMAQNDQDRLGNDEAAITTVVSICQRQEQLLDIGQVCAEALLQRSNLTDTLATLASSHDISRFLQPFLFSIAQLPASTRNLTVFDDLLSKAVTDASVRAQICRSGSAALLAALQASEEPEAESRLIPLLARLRQLDAESFLVATHAFRDWPSLPMLLIATLSSSAGTDGTAFGIRDAQEPVRRTCFEELLTSTPLDEEKEAISKDDVLLLLADDSPSVSGLLTATVLSTISKSLSSEEIVDACVATCQGETLPRATLINHVNFLAHFPQHADQIVQGLWSKLCLTKSGKKSSMAVWTTLAGSKLLEKSILKDVKVADEPTARSNWDISKVIAANIAALPEASGWLDFLRETMDASFFSALVLCAYVSSLKRSFKIPAQLIGVLVETAAQVDAKTGLVADGAPAQEILDACFGKPRAAKSLCKIHAALLALSVTSLHPPKDTAWNWLHTAVSVDIQLFREAAVGIFKVAHATTNEDLVKLLLQELFGRLLGEDTFAFLASMWLAASPLRVAAIQDATGLATSLKASVGPMDLQLLLPSLFGVFLEGTRQEKEAAAGFCATMLQMTEAKAALYGALALYGSTTANLAPVPAADLGQYLTELMGATSTLLQPEGIVSFHAHVGSSLDSKKKGRRLAADIFHGMMSHLNASQHPQIVVNLTSAFSQYRQEGMLDSLSPVFKPASLSALVRDLPEQDQQSVLATLFHAFEAASSAELQDTRQQGFSTFTSLLKTEHSLIQQAAFAIVKMPFLSKLSSQQKLVLINIVLEALPAKAAKNCLANLQFDPATVIGVFVSFTGALQAGTNSGTPKRQKLTSDKGVDVTAQRLLQLFDIADLDHLNATPQMVAALLDLAGVIVDHQERFQPATADLKRHIVTTLSNAMTNLRPEPMDWSNIKIAPILEIVKTSSSPLLTNEGLLLLSHLTKIVPQQVTLHMVPILAFMGASVFQRDDAASQRVIEAIMGGIVPVLAKSHRDAAQTPGDLVDALAPVVKTFTDVIVHVPAHRRTSLLLLLVRALGPQDALPSVLLNILDPAFQNKSATDSSELALSIATQCSMQERLHALSQLSDACRRLKSPSDGAKRSRILAFLLANLESAKIAAQIDSAHAKANHAFDATLSHILKTMILVRSQVTQGKDEYTAVVAACTRLLSPASFSQTVLWLFSLQQEDASIEAFTLLHQKTVHLKSSQRDAFLPAIAMTYAQSLPFAHKNHANSHAHVARTLAQLAQGSGPEEQPALMKVFEAFLGLPAHSAEVLDMLASLELALGPRLMSTAAKVVALARANLANQPTAIASSSIHLLQNLAIALSALVSPFLPDILSSSLSSPSAVSATRMETFRRNLVKSLPAKVLLPALAQSWPRRDPTESINLIKLLRDSLDRTTPEELGVTHKRVFQMLLLMLEADDGSINQAARHAYLAFALKLNENMFKPLFQQTVDWAFAEGKGSLPKQVTLLRLANEMADELQSIFIPFFKHLFTNCVSVLEGLAARPNQDTALLEALLELLITVFSFSDADYWTRTKLDQLASPLLEQLAHLGKHRSTGVLALYKSALVALIKVDSADEGFVRSINSQLLRLTRTHGLVALQALEALWLQASDVMLSLGVAETVPFLVECLEDDEARVVEAAKALVAAIEGTIGESLDSYLT